MKNAFPLKNGSPLIGGLLALAVLVSLASVWYVASLQQRCLELWGPPAARLIRQSPTVQVWRVAPVGDPLPDDSDDAVETFPFEGQRFKLYNSRTISDAPGMSHVRQALTNDRVFDWHDDRSDQQPTWQYALRFSDADQTATILFAFDIPTAGQVENGAIVSIDPAADAFEAFIEEQYPDPALPATQGP